MKIFILLLNLVLVAGLLSYSQSPQKIKYQAIVRDADGYILNAQNVSLRISILEGSTSGDAVFTETHALQTNEFGLVNIEIGGGTPVSGDFLNIGWGGNSYFVKLEMDVSGGSNYEYMGTTQLVSVPYAIYANTAGNLSTNPNKVNMISNLSPNNLNLKGSVDYCKTLYEQDFNDWRLPTIEEMLYVLNYFDSPALTDNLLWTLSIHPEAGNHNYYRTINLHVGWWGWVEGTSFMTKCRCVR